MDLQQLHKKAARLNKGIDIRYKVIPVKKAGAVQNEPFMEVYLWGVFKKQWEEHQYNKKELYDIIWDYIEKNITNED